MSEEKDTSAAAGDDIILERILLRCSCKCMDFAWYLVR